MSDDEKPPRPSITREQLRAYLSRPDTLKRARGIIGRKVQPQDVEDRLNHAVAEAMAAPQLPETEAQTPAWFDTICERVPARIHRKDIKRQRWTGPMPKAPSSDEGGQEPEVQADGDVADPGFDAQDEDVRVDGRLLRAWLERQVVDDARDAQTLAWILEWTDEERTYQQIADGSGVSLASVNKRVHDFKRKYLPRYERWRDRTLPLLLLGGAIVLVTVVLLVWSWLHRESIGPDPGFDPRDRPVPSASASAPPPPTFDQALPPPEGPPLKPKP